MQPEDFRPDDLFAQIEGLVETVDAERFTYPLERIAPAGEGCGRVGQLDRLIDIAVAAAHGTDTGDAG